ncbi:MAG: phosphoribosylanthranilate isomerase [Gammaproteobacteria bacterium]|nr:phosphoribosylanthranilate isomerase [Gammaproteobacteria bacterium]
MSVYQPMVKICGMTCPKLAYEAACAGADYIGLVFHEPSTRHVTLNQAKALVFAIKQGGAIPVAICVHQTAAEIIMLCRMLGIKTVQLHGNIARAQHAKLPVDIIKIYVLPVTASGEIAYQLADSDYLKITRDYLLFDGMSAGSGKPILTHQIKAFAGPFRYFIAGGLNIFNVAHVIQDCSPLGVDVSTGVEESPGKKSIDLIQRFISQTQCEVA